MKIISKNQNANICFGYVSVGDCFFYGVNLYLKIKEVFIAEDLKNEIEHERDLIRAEDIETEECNAICLTQNFEMSHFAFDCLVRPVTTTLTYE